MAHNRKTWEKRILELEREIAQIKDPTNPKAALALWEKRKELRNLKKGLVHRTEVENG